MSVDLSSLPDKLPNTANIDTEASAVRKIGTQSKDIRDDVQSDW
ncbi:hypothetical protein [Arthrobacter sp. JSM 101049]